MLIIDSFIIFINHSTIKKLSNSGSFIITID